MSPFVNIVLININIVRTSKAESGWSRQGRQEGRGGRNGSTQRWRGGRRGKVKMAVVVAVGRVYAVEYAKRSKKQENRINMKK